jgi:hypothetical protein
MLNEKKFKDFAQKLITEYYDLLYGYPNENNDKYDLCILNDSIELSMNKLKDYLEIVSLKYSTEKTVEVRW